jgi:hypothetical protein
MARAKPAVCGGQGGDEPPAVNRKIAALVAAAAMTAAHADMVHAGPHRHIAW